MNADGFLKLVRKYTDIDTLTPEILREFVDKIVVHHREVEFGETVHWVGIYCRFIGFIDLPELSQEQKARLAKSFGREIAPKKAG